MCIYCMTRAEGVDLMSSLQDMQIKGRMYIRSVLSDVVHETYIVVHSCTCSIMYTLQWHLFYMETLRNERY